MAKEWIGVQGLVVILDPAKPQPNFVSGHLAPENVGNPRLLEMIAHRIRGYRSPSRPPPPQLPFRCSQTERPGESDMRIGIVTKWFNSGQGVVSRHLRSALDELGHETFVLARQGKARRSRVVERGADPAWDQPGVRRIEAADVAAADYFTWIDEHGIELLMVDNLYTFSELAAVRRRGTLVVGRFVWEHFEPHHAEQARMSLDAVYSLTHAEQSRYRTLGLDTHYVNWGCHPELIDSGIGHKRDGAGDEVRFLFPGGILGRRKPWRDVLEAFMRTSNPRFRLVVRAQLENRQQELRTMADEDPRVELVVGDLPTDVHAAIGAGCDACISPSRWEGLGVPLYEALANGQPTITNDQPPMNEVVHDDVNGVLVPSHPARPPRSGISAWDPDVPALTQAIERLGDEGERTRLAAGARDVLATERSWSSTVRDLDALLAALTSR